MVGEFKPILAKVSDSAGKSMYLKRTVRENGGIRRGQNSGASA